MVHGSMLCLMIETFQQVTVIGYELECCLIMSLPIPVGIYFNDLGPNTCLEIIHTAARRAAADRARAHKFKITIFI